MQNYESAYHDLLACRKFYLKEAQLSGLIALCLQKLGRAVDSIDVYSEAIRNNPFDCNLYLGRGNVYASQSDTKCARRDYQRALHLQPRCSMAYVNMAYTMQMEGRYKKAWGLFSAGIALDQRSTAALEGRAIISLTTKNFFGAVIDISKALDISPNSAELLTNRGVIYQFTGDVVNAMNDYKVGPWSSNN